MSESRARISFSRGRSEEPGRRAWKGANLCVRVAEQAGAEAVAQTRAYRPDDLRREAEEQEEHDGVRVDAEAVEECKDGLCAVADDAASASAPSIFQRDPTAVHTPSICARR